MVKRLNFLYHNREIHELMSDEINLFFFYESPQLTSIVLHSGRFDAQNRRFI